MSEHTAEPWRVYPMEMRYAIETDDCDIAVTCAQEVGAANARRIVACVNACAGIPTEWIEDKAALPLTELKAEVEAEATALRKQVADLRAALKDISDIAAMQHETPSINPEHGDVDFNQCQGEDCGFCEGILPLAAQALAATQPQEVQP